MEAGCFIHAYGINHTSLITGDLCKNFWMLLSVPPEKTHQIDIPRSLKNELLEQVLKYYQLHLPISGEFKSHHVLREVFS